MTKFDDLRLNSLQIPLFEKFCFYPIIYGRKQTKKVLINVLNTYCLKMNDSFEKIKNDVKKHFQKHFCLFSTSFLGTLKKNWVWGKSNISLRTLKLEGYRQTSKCFSQNKNVG